MYIGQMLKSVVHTYSDGTTETVVEVVAWINDGHSTDRCNAHAEPTFDQTSVSSWDY